MIKRLTAFLAALMLLPVSFSAAEEETKTFTGPVAKTIDDLNAMLGSSESVTGMVDTPFYENVTDVETALEAMGSVMDRLGFDDTTRLVPDSVRETEDGMTYYTFRQKAGDLAVYGSAAKLIVDKNGTAASCSGANCRMACRIIPTCSRWPSLTKTGTWSKAPGRIHA